MPVSGMVNAATVTAGHSLLTRRPHVHRIHPPEELQKLTECSYFRHPRLCVVVGANGVGKTTLFEVFAFLKDSLVQKCCAPCLTLTISMCSS